MKTLPLALFPFFISSPLHAVIVAGANGDGLGNATETGLQDYLESSSLPEFSYWGNLLKVSDSSGVYLGRNDATGRGWIVTATHVSLLTVNTHSITVGGQSYTVRDSRVIKHPDANGTLNTDIRLYAIGGEVGDPALPSLPTVPLLNSNVALGDDLIMTGRSRRQQTPSEDTTPPYTWDGSVHDGGMRWGSNEVGVWDSAAPFVRFVLSEGDPVTKSTTCFASDFTDPQAGGTSYEGQGALLDSGGGVFVNRNGGWYLGGITYSVDDGPDGDAVANPAGYGDFSIFSHLPTYRSQMLSITGTLVPEPSVAALAAGGVALLFRRRRHAADGRHR